MEPPGGGGEDEGGQFCGFLLRDGKEVTRREVGCQWESPEEERKEVGCQSDLAEMRDAGVQVDLLTQQLSWRHPGEAAGVGVYICI